MQSQAVHDTGMCFRVVNNHIATVKQSVYGRDHALVSEVKEECIFFLFKIGQLPFQLFMEACVAAHHAGAHRVGKSPFGGSFCVCIPYFRMIGQTQVVVKGPGKHLLPLECHIGLNGSLQFRKHKITVSFLTVLSQGSAFIFFYSVKNIHN